MKKFKSKIFAMLFLVTLISCGGDHSTNPSSKHQEHNPSIAMVSPDIDITTRRKIEFNENFNNYKLFKEHINTWVINFNFKDKTLVNSNITCKKHIYGQKHPVRTENIGTDTDQVSVVLTISKEDPVKFNFSCDISLDGTIIHTYTGELLKSFVIEGKKNWAHHLGTTAEIDTLVLGPESHLVSSGLDVELKVNKLISFKGSIVTFPDEDGDSTPEGQPGVSGGKIKIQASEAHGVIDFELRGLNGGRQTKKPLAREALPRDLNLDGKCKSRVREDEYNPTGCSGKNGHKGLNGHTGFTGFKGGDSGSLDLTIDKNFLGLAIHYYPGIGSQGGEGGEGGLGSPGGLGMTVHIVTEKDGPVCPRCRLEASYSRTKKFPDGKPGEKGEQGKQGTKGQDGIEKESVIVIETRKEIINSFWKNH